LRAEGVRKKGRKGKEIEHRSCAHNQKLASEGKKKRGGEDYLGI